MVGYTRDTEMKYHDKTLHSGWIPMELSRPAEPNSNNPGNVWIAESWGWSPVILNAPIPPESGDYPHYNNMANLLTGPKTGGLVNERIGNKINVKWIKLRISLNAAYVGSDQSTQRNDQNGESILLAENDVTNTVFTLMRTTFRVCVVLDTQVNSADNDMPWWGVMESQRSGKSGMGGPLSEQNIENLGRFKILSDRTFEMSMDKPQKTFSVMLRNIGDVRYNASTESALVSKGIWVIFSAMVGGSDAEAAKLLPTIGISPVTFSRRMAYTDA